ncbi:hypothetical protein PAECIP111894_03792 [Paenibacillus pseudetheri]|uniref:Uncharacterized protein n=1 Tax=Paenibacillus pseudetheri TaxID=2897682 RepID=A0ABM9BFH8_9BACL|nr:hypothetical protein PAECIP111894_03792 [Paenibacillus pseudetheri]
MIFVSYVNNVKKLVNVGRSTTTQGTMIFQMIQA